MKTNKKNVRPKISPLRKRHNPRPMPDMNRILERQQDILPKHEFLVGVRVRVAVDVDNWSPCCWGWEGGGRRRRGGEGEGVDTFFGDGSHCLHAWECANVAVAVVDVIHCRYPDSESVLIGRSGVLTTRWVLEKRNRGSW